MYKKMKNTFDFKPEVMHAYVMFLRLNMNTLKVLRSSPGRIFCGGESGGGTSFPEKQYSKDTLWRSRRWKFHVYVNQPM